ncbi:hypothetical protein ColTof3_04709 [Colletotrichum tofieldiae]|nr:hypothetical protein ColTof3_04709 [Colletotrichum tofieldiae]
MDSPFLSVLPPCVCVQPADVDTTAARATVHIRPSMLGGLLPSAPLWAQGHQHHEDLAMERVDNANE